MKKGLLASYVEGLFDRSKGESYATILHYFWPEFVTALVLYSVLYLLDARFIAELKSTSTYAMLGVTNTLLHFIVKVAEGLSIGTVVLCGQYNGAKNEEMVGRSFVETFWMMAFLGLIFSSLLYFGAGAIYSWFGVPSAMLLIGIPFLRLRAVGVLFMFLYFGFVAFLRGIKNTKTPMHVFVFGSLVFIFFDYALIFGKFGLPELKFLGSAWATVLQYGVMLVVIAGLVLFDKRYQKYRIQLLTPLTDITVLKRFFALSWPVVIDKATMATAYIWLGKMIAPMGTCALASFTVIKDMERFAFLPAIAFAQIITLLVSNDFGSNNTAGIKNNIKKILLIAMLFVGVILLVFSWHASYFVSIFDKKRVFTAFAAAIFPILSPLVLCDVTQIILSGALRGAADVQTVMKTRILVCILFFAPLSYLIAQASFCSALMKFTLIYAIFYCSNGIMSFIYVSRFRSGRWKKITEQE